MHAGGTRFIGVYLARQLVEDGHSVTLLTRGKKPVTFQIPDDTDESYKQYQSSVKHIAADRSDPDGIKAAISGQGFDGAVTLRPCCLWACLNGDECTTRGATLE